MQQAWWRRGFPRLLVCEEKIRVLLRKNKYFKTYWPNHDNSTCPVHWHPDKGPNSWCLSWPYCHCNLNIQISMFYCACTSGMNGQCHGWRNILLSWMVQNISICLFFGRRSSCWLWIEQWIWKNTIASISFGVCFHRKDAAKKISPNQSRVVGPQPTNNFPQKSIIEWWQRRHQRRLTWCDALGH